MNTKSAGQDNFLQRIRETVLKTPPSPNLTPNHEYQWAKTFGEYLEDQLQLEGIDLTEFSAISGIDLELATMLLKGELPVSLIDRPLLREISKGIDVPFETLEDILEPKQIPQLQPAPNNFYEVVGDDGAVNFRYHKVYPGLKRALGKFFAAYYMADLLKSSIRRVFFESGSSIVHFVEPMLEALKQDPHLLHLAHELEIETNNRPLARKLFDFEELNYQRYPGGPSRGPYGAYFGEELLQLEDRSPARTLRSLDSRERQAIATLKQHFVEQYRQNGLLFMAASGIELDPNSPFPGPHVGSYHNMLFKRAIIESRCPIIIPVHENKLFDGFDVKACHTVGGPDYPWQTAENEQPIAIAVACSSRDNAATLRQQCINAGFPYAEIRPYERSFHILVAANEKFHDFLHTVLKVTEPSPTSTNTVSGKPMPS